MSLNSKLVFAALTFIAFSLAAVSSAQADTVFVYTGTGNGTYSGGASGAGLTGGTNSTSPSSQAFRELPLGNSVATLTIGGLAPNSSVTINFNLYAILSLDGNGPTGNNSAANPDFFNLTADSTTLLNASFANYPGNTQSYPSNLPGGSSAPGTGSSAQNTLGYTAFYSPGYADTTYTLSYTATANASGSITFTFAGGQNQGAGDESFGIDNITVAGTPAGTPAAAVPEPTTMLLLGTGLAGVAAKVRKRRKTDDSE